MKIACLLLAAGSSSRMKGANKLLLEVNGESFVRRTLKEITRVSLSEVVVVTGHEADRVRTEIESLPAKVIFNNNFATGMHSSIRAGLLALESPCDAFFVCLCDQPHFDHQILMMLKNVRERSGIDGIFAPTFAGQKGHPVLISSRFIPEILAHDDGDHGCSYLFKRHPQDVIAVEVDSSGVVIDVDEPADYEALQVIDPVEEFYKKTARLLASSAPFAVATVIEVIGSASARVGSKALFDREGRNVLGWIGGGCAERFVGEESKQAIECGRARTVLADLDDEIFGLGVACGGKMRIFIDPHLPAEQISLPITPKYENEIRSLSGFYGWNIQYQKSMKSPETPEQLLIELSRAAAQTRARNGRSLRIVKGVPAKFKATRPSLLKKVTIVGRTRITEALARHFSLLSYSVRAIGPDLRSSDYPSNVECRCLDGGYDEVSFREGEVVVIASHTSQDREIVRRALEARASHVAMVGSLKRSKEVLEHLGLIDQVVEEPLFIPAGLDIDAKNPDEIALSIVAEVAALKESAP